MRRSRSAVGREKGPPQPILFTSAITVEFWLNDDENLPTRALSKLAREVASRFHISALAAPESVDIEHGRLFLAFAAAGSIQGEKLARQIMEYLESNTPGRIIGDDWQQDESAFA